MYIYIYIDGAHVQLLPLVFPLHGLFQHWLGAYSSLFLLFGWLMEPFEHQGGGGGGVLFGA
jgi:hypothetical protein